MRSNVTKASLPAVSSLHGWRKKGDFLDCYTVASDMSPRAAAEIITNFPNWARKLLVLRGIVTAPFGLDNDGPDATDKVGIFPVESQTDQEIVAGFNDKHLNFRVAVLSIDGRVSLATWVSPHHVGGRIYLALILPFHIAIARDGLRRVARTS